MIKNAEWEDEYKRAFAQHKHGEQSNPQSTLGRNNKKKNSQQWRRRDWLTAAAAAAAAGFFN